MLSFKCKEKEITMDIVKADYMNHMVHIIVFPNIDGSLDFEIKFIKGEIFARLPGRVNFEYYRFLDEVLRQVDIPSGNHGDKNMTAFTSFIQTLREATD